MDCSICFETVDAQFFTWLKCSHCLCNACFEKLTQSLCPFCREIIDDEEGSTNTILSSPIITSRFQTNREETSILYSIFHGVSSPFQIDDEFDNSFITEYDVWDVEINRRDNSRRRRNQRRNQGRNNRQRIMNSILPNSLISNSENNTNNNTQESMLIEIPNIVNEVERNRASNRWNSIRNQISRFMRNQ